MNFLRKVYLLLTRSKIEREVIYSLESMPGIEFAFYFSTATVPHGYVTDFFCKVTDTDCSVYYRKHCLSENQTEIEMEFGIDVKDFYDFYHDLLDKEALEVPPSKPLNQEAPCDGLNFQLFYGSKDDIKSICMSNPDPHTKQEELVDTTNQFIQEVTRLSDI